MSPEALIVAVLMYGIMPLWLAAGGGTTLPPRRRDRAQHRLKESMRHSAQPPSSDPAPRTISRNNGAVLASRSVRYCCTKHGHLGRGFANGRARALRSATWHGLLECSVGCLHPTGHAWDADRQLGAGVKNSVAAAFAGCSGMTIWLRLRSGGCAAGVLGAGGRDSDARKLVDSYRPILHDHLVGSARMGDCPLSWKCRAANACDSESKSSVEHGAPTAKKDGAHGPTRGRHAQPFDDGEGSRGRDLMGLANVRRRYAASHRGAGQGDGSYCVEEGSCGVAQLERA